MLPLDDITVVDFSQLVSGPYCTMLLADMGANVIKVEPPGVGDMSREFLPFINGESAFFMAVNRNKRSIAVDIRGPAGLEVILKLLARADVLIHNFRPGVMEKLSLGYDDIAERFPRLVYCSISAFGERGPRATRPGVDLVFQGDAGMMSITGEPGGQPVKGGTNIADVNAATLGAFGIMTALWTRERTGHGQKIELPVLDALVSLETCWAAYYFATGTNPGAMGSASPFSVPNEHFQTLDSPINVAIVNDRLWHRLCAVLEIPDMADDPRFRTNPARLENRDALIPLLSEIFRLKPAREWLERLDAAGVPCGRVRTFEEMVSDPQLLHNGMIQRIQHPVAGEVRAVGFPLHLSETPGGIRQPSPTLGQHTREVLRELGYGDKDVQGLKHAGVID